MSDTSTRFSLRVLPLPAKLVISAFLISVGLGYSSAMVQLHLQHGARDGAVLPTANDVIERFAGLKKYDPDGPRSPSKIESLISGSTTDLDVNANNMAPAFFARSKGYTKEVAERGKADVDAERESERLAMLEWLRSETPIQRKAYAEDAFQLTSSLRDRGIVSQWLTADGESIKIKTLFEARCNVCHTEQQQPPSMTNFVELQPLITPPSDEVLPGGWVRSGKQMTIDSLTQSTHTHLLSFAMLFTMTGLCFAFTNYSLWLRGILGPIVLIAQVCDVSCWWLARIPDYGPIFAQTILLTGSVVGLGLGLQIVLSLFNMYGGMGKLVLAGMFVVAGLVFAFIGVKVIQPALEAEIEKAKQIHEAESVQPHIPEPALGENVPTTETITKLEQLIMGPREESKEHPFNGRGTMAPVFFEKDPDYRREIKDRPQAEVDAEREGERAALVAWIRSEPSLREASYGQGKSFPLPEALVGKPITDFYLSDDQKSVKIEEIFFDRCSRCHADGNTQEDYPLESYADIAEYLK